MPSNSSFKNKFYSIISSKKNSIFGRILYSISQKLIKVFENKNNNHHTNGEFWLIRKLQNTNPKVIFDVGANRGDWTLFINSQFPNSTIFSFEPIPATYQELEKNTNHLSGITCYNLALSNESEKIEMNYFKGNSLFSSVYKHPSLSNEYETFLVDTVSGGEFCQNNLITSIDFLKLDVEGSEFKILQGFLPMLEEKRIRLIQFEYGEFSIESKILLKDFYDFFERLGYSVGKIYPKFVDFSPYTVTKENFLTSNFVALAKNDPLKDSF